MDTTCFCQKSDSGCFRSWKSAVLKAGDQANKPPKSPDESVQLTAFKLAQEPSYCFRPYIPLPEKYDDQLIEVPFTEYDDQWSDEIDSRGLDQSRLHRFLSYIKPSRSYDLKSEEKSACFSLLYRCGIILIFLIITLFLVAFFGYFFRNNLRSGDKGSKILVHGKAWSSDVEWVKSAGKIMKKPKINSTTIGPVIPEAGDLPLQEKRPMLPDYESFGDKYFGDPVISNRPDGPNDHNLIDIY